MKIHDLSKRIKANETTFENSDIYLEINELIFPSLHVKEDLRFHNCVFHSDFKLSNIKNNQVSLFFTECTFLGEIIFDRCEFTMLNFLEIKKAKHIFIQYGEYETVSFRNSPKSNADINEINLISVKINHSLNFSDFKFNGTLSINFPFTEDKLNRHFSIENSELNSLRATHVDFGDESNFKNLLIKEDLSFKGCTLNQTDFSKLRLSGKLNFQGTVFNNYVSFKECSSFSDNNYLSFKNCIFKQLVEFDNSAIQILDLENTIFENVSSFQDIIVGSIRIKKTSFLKSAFFDNIRIKDLNKSAFGSWSKIKNITNFKKVKNVFTNTDWMRTLRVIKQELQKTENRIDFNKFRAYEMGTYYNELTLKDNFVEKTILWATKWSTNFGNSWRRSIAFTLSCGFLFYLFFYLIENRNGTIDILNCNNWSKLFSGFFRFLLVTDFYNPLETDRMYLTNPFSWIIFIFGKIVIAFGIYEMIQAFRKFKP